MTKSANDIVTAAIMLGGHPLHDAIAKILFRPPSCPSAQIDPRQVHAIATDILVAMREIDFGDAPSEALRHQVERLTRENNGLILALARLSGEAKEASDA